MPMLPMEVWLDQNLDDTTEIKPGDVFWRLDCVSFESDAHGAPTFSRGHALHSMNLEEAKKQAETMATSLVCRYRELGGVLERQESLLVRRWSKKSRSRRCSILRAAWPGTSTPYRPVLRILYQWARIEITGMVV